MADTEAAYKPPLLAMPLEIRLQIYSEILALSKIYTQHVEMIVDPFRLYPGWLPNVALKLPSVGLAIFLACKQTHAEFRSVLYSYLDDDFTKRSSKMPDNVYCFRSAMKQLRTMSCSPLVAPMLLRANTDCVAEEEANEHDSSVHNSQLSNAIQVHTSRLRYVTVLDQSNLLYAMTREEDLVHAALFPSESAKENPTQLRQVKLLRDCVHAFWETSKQRRVPTLQITRVGAVPNRQIEMRFVGGYYDADTAPETHDNLAMRIRVYVFGIGERWYKVAEARLRALLELEGIADYYFTLDSLDRMEAQRSWARWKDAVHDYLSRCSPSR